MSGPTQALVLGTDGKLWLENAPRGNVAQAMNYRVLLWLIALVCVAGGTALAAGKQDPNFGS